MVYTVEIYFLLFISYAFLGWGIEVSCKWIQYGKFINRGFLIGPYCPIYGWGALAITILLGKYRQDPIALFIMAIVICSIIEYFTSYFMEKKYHARWWDYSNKKFNINGRICLETMIPFGILGCIIMYFINPVLLQLYRMISPIMAHFLAGMLCVLFVVDNIISSSVIKSIKAEGLKIAKDDTEEITEKVKQILRDKSILHRRLMNAFPNLKDLKIKSWIKKRKQKKSSRIV